MAAFRGKPHVHESQFGDIEDECTDRLLLMEIVSDPLSPCHRSDRA
jgi:hypothetical protein